VPLEAPGEVSGIEEIARDRGIVGAAATGGATPLTAILGHGEPVAAPGFVRMDAPGHDPVSASGRSAR
jgi:altronate dehydratase